MNSFRGAAPRYGAPCGWAAATVRLRQAHAPSNRVDAAAALAPVASADGRSLTRHLCSDGIDYASYAMASRCRIQQRLQSLRRL